MKKSHKAPSRYTIQELLRMRKTLKYVSMPISKFKPDAWTYSILSEAVMKVGLRWEPVAVGCSQTPANTSTQLYQNPAAKASSSPPKEAAGSGTASLDPASAVRQPTIPSGIQGAGFQFSNLRRPRSTGNMITFHGPQGSLPSIPEVRVTPPTPEKFKQPRVDPTIQQFTLLQQQIAALGAGPFPQQNMPPPNSNFYLQQQAANMLHAAAIQAGFDPAALAALRSHGYSPQQQQVHRPVVNFPQPPKPTSPENQRGFSGSYGSHSNMMNGGGQVPSVYSQPQTSSHQAFVPGGSLRSSPVTGVDKGQNPNPDEWARRNQAGILAGVPQGSNKENASPGTPHMPAMSTSMPRSVSTGDIKGKGKEPDLSPPGPNLCEKKPTHADQMAWIASMLQRTTVRRGTTMATPPIPGRSTYENSPEGTTATDW